MFRYSETQEYTVTHTKAWLLAFLCAVWIGTGLIGHDPWKPDEEYTFGLIYHILKSGDWLVPTLAGEPFMDKPPLFYITAALFAKLFSPWLSLHNGARLACGFYTTLTLLFMGLTGRDLFGKGRGWSTAIILIGCLGMLVRSHLLVADLALLTGMAMMLYGYTLALRFRRRAGIFLGTSVGIGFMAKGFIAPVLFLLISIALLLFRSWRHRPYYMALGFSLLCASPWLVIWPWLLYQHSPHLFMEWAWVHNIGHWLHYAQNNFGKNSWYYLQVLPWLAWPAWPLAAWAVWHERRNLRYEAEYQLLLASFIIMLITLSLVPNIQDLFALPMLLPLALLATAALPGLRRGAANALDWFGIMTFGLITILMWWGWAGLLLDNNAKITSWLKEYQPGYIPTVNTPSFWIAVIATIAWIILVWRVGRSIRRSVINWAGGVTLLWILTMTLWLPWLESGKSYRHVMVELKHKLPAHYNCIAREGLGDNQRAMLEYFAGITTRRYAAHSCNLLLVQEGQFRVQEDKARWKQIWEGSRTGDRHERFRLYQKISS